MTKTETASDLKSLLYADDFKEIDITATSNFVCHIDRVGVFTVLERRTGFSFIAKKIETGFRDIHGKFWLAAGDFDIRSFLPLTVEQAIKKVKQHSNICKGI